MRFRCWRWRGITERQRARPRCLALIAVYCTSQLLEQIGTVVLLTWLGDLVPRRSARVATSARRTLRATLVQSCQCCLLQRLGDGVLVHEHYQRSIFCSLAVRCNAHWASAAFADAGGDVAALENTGRAESRVTEDEPRSSRNWRRRCGNRRRGRLLGYGCWFAFSQRDIWTAAPQNLFPMGVLETQRPRSAGECRP